MRQAQRTLVVVLNYCSLDDTMECVAAVRRSSYPCWRLLVIDNASPDLSGASLSSTLPPDEFLQLPRNVGYAGGNNHGLTRALHEGFDYVVVVNPDVRIPPSGISDYVDEMESDPAIGALSPLQVGADLQSIDRNVVNGILAPNGYEATTVEELSSIRVLETDLLFGACLMLSRAALERVGGFDPLFFAYGEDDDLSRRLRWHGFRLVLTTRSPAQHLRSREAAGAIPALVRMLRLRGTYLNELKSSDSSFGRAIARTVRDLARAAVGRPPARYPFTYCAISPAQSVRVLVWLLSHLPQVWVHRQRERRGPEYL